MIRLYDGKKLAEVTLQLGSNPSWEHVFYNSGALEYNEVLNAYKVDDVDYCIKQALNWGVIVNYIVGR